MLAQLKPPSTEQVTAVLLLALAAIVVLYLVLRLLRSLARSPRAIRWAWTRTRPVGLERKRRWRIPIFCSNVLALVTVWLANRSLRVRPFEAPEGIDGEAVSAALSAAMSRIASPRDSGVDTVTAPIEAETAVDAIASAVKAVPSGGELAAALVHLSASLLAPGELQLSGRVLPSNSGGPGLALTLATGRGRVRERVTLRADQFEPTVGLDGDPGEDLDRLTRLATVGAVWTHFQILESEWRLRTSELRSTMRTNSWRSYALTRVGAENDVRLGANVARALYADAVDSDPDNLVAQFNLASLELKDSQLKQVRRAARRRLDHVHVGLERDSECGPSPERLLPRPAAGLLLRRDPLCYQVCYKRVADKLNREIAEEEHLEGQTGRRYPAVPECADWLADGTGAPCCRLPAPRIRHAKLDARNLQALARHIRDLELTLAILAACDHRKWRMASSKSWAQRTDLLCAIEGPMLVLWAMVALRVGDACGDLWTPKALWTPEPSLPSSGAQSRDAFVETIESGELTPAGAVDQARGQDVMRRSRTRFNLACWYSDLGHEEQALRELELSLEGGGERARRRVGDRQLRHLQFGSYRREWLRAVQRYDPEPRSDSPTQSDSSAPPSSPAPPDSSEPPSSPAPPDSSAPPSSPAPPDSQSQPDFPTRPSASQLPGSPAPPDSSPQPARRLTATTGSRASFDGDGRPRAAAGYPPHLPLP
ncbi:MAG TPA: hypothetical protein VHU13_08005 [Solirubrobacteraceae bacterium]|nr:hypothetical protein [Solirubrobacteraceae bacterium]